MMETIEDIIREMREAIGVDASEAATKREPLYNLCKNLSNENDTCRAAIAPVLAIPTDSLTGLWGVPLPDGGMMLTPEGVANAMRFIEAVRACQRIYNGEGDEG